jgi:hypothetical protein
MPEIKRYAEQRSKIEQQEIADDACMPRNKLMPARKTVPKTEAEAGLLENAMK